MTHQNKDMEIAAHEVQNSHLAQSRFLGNLSHDLKTPLNLLLGTLELVQEKNQATEKDIQNLQNSANHINDLIDDILYVAQHSHKDQTKQMLPINVKSFFKDIETLVIYEIQKKGLQLAINIDRNIPEYLICDSVRVKQIIVHLILNSIKFTDQGSIKIRISQLKKTVLRKSKVVTLRIQVCDTGRGIPLNKRNELFSNFLNINSDKNMSKNGLGLALSLVKEQILYLNGSMSIDSEEDIGTEFTVDLDFEIDSNTQEYIESINNNIENQYGTLNKQPSSSHLNSNHHFLTSTPVIMIVDDDLGNRQLFESYFSQKNWSLVFCENGKEAYLKYQIQQPDIIVADLRMPVMDGMELTDKIRKYESVNKFSQIPIILVTADTLEQTEITAKEHKITVFLTKPIRKKVILEEIDNLLKNTIRPH